MKNSVWSALNLAWELGYTIAIPIALLGFGGAWLDKKFGTSPWMILLGIAISLLVSSVAVYRKVKSLS